MTHRSSAGLVFMAVLGLVGVQAQEAPARPLRERLLERAVKGDTEAQYELGKHYEAGRIGLPQDFVQAAHWYREAAEKGGDAYAEMALGIFYQFGKGMARDYVQAYVWYERAAAQLTGGDQESVAEMRDSVFRKLNPSQRELARRLMQETRAK